MPQDVEEVRGTLRLWIVQPRSSSDGIATAAGTLTTVESEDHVIRATLRDAHGVTSAFGMELPDGCRAPFEPGDELVVRSRSRIEGIHPISDSSVTRASGELLAAQLDSADLTFVPGLSLTSRAGAGKEHPVLLTYAGTTVEVVRYPWRRFSANGTPWLARGAAVSYGPGPRPPDARDYTTVSLLREAR